MSTTTRAAKGGRLGTMICFHPRFRLGKRHDYEEPIDFLRDLVKSAVEPRAVVDYVLSGEPMDVQLQFDLDTETWDIIYRDDYSVSWEAMENFTAIQGQIPEVAGALLHWLSLGDLHHLASEEHVILPVIIPDASTPNLQSHLFGPAWGTGQAGWIYAPKEKVLRRFDAPFLDSLVRYEAEAVLKAEVEGRANPRRRRGKGAAI